MIFSESSPSKMNESDDYSRKLTRMLWLEKERRKRIFDEKQRTIGVDKLALENQVREKQFKRQLQQNTDDVFKQNLNFYNQQALQRELLVKHQAYKEAENLRQVENMRLAQEQKLRNKRINDDALANIPTDTYHNYFNMSSR